MALVEQEVRPDKGSLPTGLEFVSLVDERVRPIGIVRQGDRSPIVFGGQFLAESLAGFGQQDAGGLLGPAIRRTTCQVALTCMKVALEERQSAKAEVCSRIGRVSL